MYSKLLVAVDKSEHSQRAVEVARDLARRTGSEVLVLHVKERAMIVGKFGAPFDLEAEEDVEKLLSDELGVFKEAGVPVSAQVRSVHIGRVASQIVEAAKDFGADMIVMGSRGHSEFATLVIGSVAHKVLQFAERPVLVVH